LSGQVLLRIGHSSGRAADFSPSIFEHEFWPGITLAAPAAMRGRVADASFTELKESRWQP